MNLYEIGLPDPQQFHIKEIDNKILIHRKEAGVKWDEKNKYFRSSLWDKESGKLISAGFRAFTNYGEQPDFEPLPNNSVKAITKLDGSCLIVSKYKGELIIRTRGTVDASKLENGYEIELLKKKYPVAFDNDFLDNEMHTLLFEWTTPTNRIVLRETEEPTLWLIGIVFHIDYSYVDQHYLDQYAIELGVERPKTYSISADADIETLKKQIEPLKDIEGVVIYDNETNQILKKIKTLRYLELHRVFTGVKSVNHLFDLYVDYVTPKRDEFEEQLAKNFDWELVTTLKPLMDELYTKIERIDVQINSIMRHLDNPEFVELDRKGKAKNILELFPDCSGIAFAMLDGKTIALHKLWETFS